MNPFQKTKLSLFIIFLFIIKNVSACESKQKGISEFDNVTRSLEILAELDKWIKVDTEAFDKRDYCLAMKACQNELELLKEYQTVERISNCWSRKSKKYC